MSRLVETIRINNGIPENLGYHDQRISGCLSDLYGIEEKIILSSVIIVPANASTGIFKCRIEYDKEIRKMEFQPYSIRPVTSLKLVEDNEIDYKYKSADRTRLDTLFERKGDCDDILIIKNGFVTDTYYANIVFKSTDGVWITPESCLLKGIRRAALLHDNVIKEAKVSVSDIKKYTEARLINAMIDIYDTEGIRIENII